MTNEPVFPNFAEWLMQRGVPVTTAHRVCVLNRSVTDRTAGLLATLYGTADGAPVPHCIQAARAIAMAFKYEDTWEGKKYWTEFESKLRALA